MKRIIIITGASSGMGAEFARQVYTQHKNTTTQTEMWLIAREDDKLRDFATTLTGKNILVRTFAFDLRGSVGAEHVNNLLNTESKNGKFVVDLLINNAGFGTYGPFAETDPAREMSMVELNCTALTGICGFVLPYMQRGGHIINVASLAAFLPLGNFAVYAATKSYVLSFSMALAAELKERGISVCALCPGSVSTNFANVASNGKRREVLHGRDPRKVVAHCLRASQRNKKIALWATKWKVTAFLSRFVGRYIGARFTYLFNKRPH
ncbi:MAG: SDR family NAD(P)-dependent oxidoreductase [Alphaproteobacteria bacterium]|nr:SDR family NAD(P)-dependent oxidoreductase [Alphaproteobacteria bacterium]